MGRSPVGISRKREWKNAAAPLRKRPVLGPQSDDAPEFRRCSNPHMAWLGASAPPASGEARQAWYLLPPTLEMGPDRLVVCRSQARQPGSVQRLQPAYLGRRDTAQRHEGLRSSSAMASARNRFATWAGPLQRVPWQISRTDATSRSPGWLWRHRILREFQFGFRSGVCSETQKEAGRPLRHQRRERSNKCLKKLHFCPPLTEKGPPVS